MAESPCWRRRCRWVRCAPDPSFHLAVEGPASAFATSFLVSVLFTGCVIPIDNTTPSPAMTQPGGDAGASDEAGMPPDAVGGTAPPGTWKNVTANLANMSSECGNLSSLFVKPDEDLVLAGVALKGLWGSRNGGMTWEGLGQGPGSASISNHPQSLVWDPANPMHFWEAGIYGMAGVFSTADDGTTFTQLGMVFQNNAVSVDLSDPMHLTLVAGGHEAATMLAHKLWKSTDGGMTWTEIGGGIPVNMDCTWPLVLDAQTFLAGCSGYAGPYGIQRTTDGGMTWTSVSHAGGDGLPLLASDGSIYWETPNKMGVVRSADKGKTWSDIGGAGVVNGSLIELPDKRLVTLGVDSLIMSADKGTTWKRASGSFPYTAPVSPNGVVYSTRQKAFFIWHNTCPQGQLPPIPVPTDAIMRFDFDYQTQ